MAIEALGFAPKVQSPRPCPAAACESSSEDPASSPPNASASGSVRGVTPHLRPGASEEEYLAFCLMMLSRDTASLSSAAAQPAPPPQKLVHACSICGKAFGSYQALGGHMASHRKPVSVDDRALVGSPAASASSSGATKAHRCLICLKTFPTGQASAGTSAGTTTEPSEALLVPEAPRAPPSLFHPRRQASEARAELSNWI
ncbi:hypothetical protein HPP92_013704 [Vanilla planifolia]|uniref:C2H2-type domain-containing protein n=1 Tax=Vanilla planifolia TaxID=51239 RepID=A0A835QSS4_VANPL|nr:hypothetical protein HPP92_013704 [Vanilla planifolia]